MGGSLQTTSSESTKHTESPEFVDTTGNNISVAESASECQNLGFLNF